MRWMEWAIALSMIIIGLSCLTVSGTWMLNPDSIRPYLNTFLQICLWIGIPVLLAIIVYFVFKVRKGT
jgi:hypothetical protein